MLTAALKENLSFMVVEVARQLDETFDFLASGEVAAFQKINSRDDYIDTDYSISETRFNAWPTTLKETSAKARTVKPGKTGYRIALVQEPHE